MKNNKAYDILFAILLKHGEKQQMVVDGIIYQTQFNDVINDIMTDSALPKLLLQGKKADKFKINSKVECGFHNEGYIPVTISKRKFENNVYYYIVKERPEEGWIDEINFK